MFVFCSYFAHKYKIPTKYKVKLNRFKLWGPENGQVKGQINKQVNKFPTSGRFFFLTNMNSPYNFCLVGTKNNLFLQNSPNSFPVYEQFKPLRRGNYALHRRTEQSQYPIVVLIDAEEAACLYRWRWPLGRLDRK